MTVLMTFIIFMIVMIAIKKLKRCENKGALMAIITPVMISEIALSPAAGHRPFERDRELGEKERRAHLADSTDALRSCNLGVKHETKNPKSIKSEHARS